MDQKQLDDLEEPLESEESKEESFPQDSAEKMNDVNEIIDREETENEEEINEERKEEPLENKEEVKEETKEPENTFNWDDDDEDSKSGKGWKYFSGLLVILLVAAIYTNGFNFTGATVIGADSITQIDAEDKVLAYVNNNLLQPPFTATVVSSEDAGNLFQVTIDVAGQEVDSYITKDGQYFFPQGFNLDAAPLDLETPGPETELIDVSVDDDPMKGSAQAPVTIVEFSEFECPFCKRYIDDAYQQIIKDYVNTGKVKYVFRDFPLSFHQNAKPAAMAAECAHEQNKFWEYHDLLFANQDQISPENFKKWAEELDLDTAQFNDCFDTEKYSAEVDADMADGQSYGVSGTPAFFINGQMISGAQPYAAFRAAIEEALQAAETTTETTEEEEEETDEIVIELPTEEEEEETPAEEPTSDTKELSIIAKKWRFDPKHLEATKGDELTLTITSEYDLDFLLPAFSINQEVKANTPKTIEFTATKTGSFEFSCGDFCKETYGEIQGSALTGELVVE